MNEIREARTIRKQGPGPGWTDATVRMHMAQNRLREMRAARSAAAAARVAK